MREHEKVCTKHRKEDIICFLVTIISKLIWEEINCKDVQQFAKKLSLIKKKKLDIDIFHRQRFWSIQELNRSFCSVSFKSRDRHR